MPHEQITANKMTMEMGAMEVQKHVEDGEKILDEDNTCLVQNSVRNTVRNNYQLISHDEAV